MIRAEFATDDSRCVVAFDATKFFEDEILVTGRAEAYDKKFLEDLSDEYDPRGDTYGPGYASDEIASFADSDEIQLGLRHCAHSMHADWLGEEVGFGVRVNAQDLDRWMLEHGVPWVPKSRARLPNGT
jgi:hypothetical protein